MILSSKLGDPGSGVLAEKLTKLAAMRFLSDGLERIEKQHQQRIDRGNNPAEVDREFDAGRKASLMPYVNVGIDSGLHDPQSTVPGRARLQDGSAISCT